MIGTRVVVTKNRLPAMATQFEPRVASKINTAVVNTIMYADAETPVNIGLLRANKTVIFAAPGRLSGKITWNQHYAGYVHDGTIYMEGRPFAGNAAERVTPGYLADLANLGLA